MRNSFLVILEIIKKEFYQIRQDKRMLGVSIAAPILQVLLLGYAATTDIKNSTMVVCDMDRTPASREFIREFTNSGYFVEKYAVDVPDDVDRYVEVGNAAIALIIPVDFGSRLLSRESTPVQVILDGSDANTAATLLNYANQIVLTYSRKVLAEAASLRGGVKTALVLPEPRIWFNPDLTSSNYMVPGVVALVLMIITMTLTSLGIVREKEIGTLEQLMVTPIRPYQLIVGKLLPFALIGLVDMSIVLSLAHYWFTVPLVGSIVLLFGLSAIFVLTTLGLGLLISTIATSQQQAMLIAQFFFFMPFMFFSGFAFPISNMPPPIQALSFLTPLRYFLEILRGIFLKGADLSQLWPQTLALLGFGVAILTMSVLRFRKKLE